MIQKPKQDSISGGISDSDIRFIKTYYKQKKSYEGSQLPNINNYDCNKRQAPLKTFCKVKRKDYNLDKHENRIKDFFGKNEKTARELIDFVKAVSGFKDNFHGDIIAQANKSIS